MNEEIEKYKALSKYCCVDVEDMGNKLYVTNDGMYSYNRTMGTIKLEESEESFESIVKTLIRWYEHTGIYTPIIYKDSL